VLRQHGTEMAGEALCRVGIEPLTHEHFHPAQHTAQFLEAVTTLDGAADRRSGFTEPPADELRRIAADPLELAHTGGRP